MDFGKESQTLNEKLAAPVAKVIEKNQTRIAALLSSDRVVHVGQALNNDEQVRRVATFCYPLLPGLLRMVVKEAAFVSFVMTHRHQLLASFAPPATPGQAA